MPVGARLPRPFMGGETPPLHHRFSKSEVIMAKIGINGFGRIGRLAFRAAVERPDAEVVGINDLVEPEYLAYMLRYDSTQGKFPGTVEAKGNTLIVNGKKIRITA